MLSVMDRFDRSFNEIDPKTGKPFSSGHPDGVWIITILYSLLSIGLIVSAIIALLSYVGSAPETRSAQVLLGVLGPLLGVVIMVGVMYFMFRRSNKAFIVNLIMSGALATMVVMTLTSGGDVLMLLFIFGAHLSITAYLFLLMRASLLFSK